MKYRCLNCGYIYDQDKEELSFVSLDAEWTCPECNASKSEFEPVEESEEEMDLEDKEEMTKTDGDLKAEYY